MQFQQNGSVRITFKFTPECDPVLFCPGSGSVWRAQTPGVAWSTLRDCPLRSRTMLFVPSFRRLKRSMRSSFYFDGSVVDSARTPILGRLRAIPPHSFNKPRLRKWVDGGVSDELSDSPFVLPSFLGNLAGVLASLGCYGLYSLFCFRCVVS